MKEQQVGRAGLPAAAAIPIPIPIPCRKFKPNAFGFFYCNITTPQYLEHPIIQTHVKTKSGIRTMSALGNFSDIIFSEEMDNAIKLEYKFEILGVMNLKN